MNRKALLSFFLFSLLSVIVVVPVRAQTINSGWTNTPPTINGVIALGEWDDAGLQAFTLQDFLGNPTAYTGTLFVMNDATNLYIAIELSEDASATNDIMTLFFDGNNNGLLDNNDEGIAYGPPFEDIHFRTTPTPGAWFHDYKYDGDGAGTRIVSDWVFEFYHPLCSGDTQDFCLNLGDIVGFNLMFYDVGAMLWYTWPSTQYISGSIRDWGDIKIALEPQEEPPEPVGGEVFQTDKPAILTPYLLVALAIVTATSLLIKKRKH